MQTQRRAWKVFQRYNVVNFVVKTFIASVFGFGFIGTPLRAPVEEIDARPLTTCSSTDQSSLLPRAEILEQMAAFSHYPGMITVPVHPLYVRYLALHSTLCVDAKGITERASQAAQETKKALLVVPNQSQAPVLLLKQAAPAELIKSTVVLHDRAAHKQVVAFGMEQVLPYALLAAARAGSRANVFPYGQCTWWANQRYYQIHGVFVPWHTNANAGQWIARAVEYGWRVSGYPTVGSIIVLSAGVQGASQWGHVGVVEQVLNNGTSVIASSVNWGNHPEAVTDSQFYPGPGVAFLSQR
ncbi:CHAP domain-containing protein [Tengunoibacter tsumagoiensis]|uniref:Peptidase C51 domain-containing protein n=1 Tax=Tengunoibacter tsumagoiensis TaxID=2014871 RepID=A0A401ZUI5_9CHLR|nr:CHAP domain-containing protein [Tengunoibacter tsumagoiensis]GCE10585.1 hypothetical protein KTT_04440 [Tengunoibacter tsumagoiensis]